MSTDDELKEVNREIRSILGGNKKIAVAALVVIVLGISAFLFFFGPETIGFATFSETTSSTYEEDFTVTGSGTVSIATDLQDINALLLSGTVYGSGTAAVYLKKGDRKILAYYFEGNAEGGKEFTDMCYGTCHVEDMDRKNELIFELDGTVMHVDRIKYLYSKIIDFDLTPKETTINFKEEKARIVNLVLTNDQLVDYKVLLYIEGPLTDYFSYPGSVIEVSSAEQEKTIPITVKLPADLPEGTYDHRVTVRYIPPSEFDFVGETPSETAMITVING